MHYRPLSTTEIGAMVAALSGKKCRVAVQEHGYAFGQHEDGSYTIKVPAKIEQESFDEFIGSVVHECLHAKYTTSYDGDAAVDALKHQGLPEICSRVLFMAINAIEDARIELLARREYPGVKDMLERCYKIMMPNAVMSMRRAVKFKEFAGQGAELAAAKTTLYSGCTLSRLTDYDVAQRNRYLYTAAENEVAPAWFKEQDFNALRKKLLSVEDTSSSIDFVNDHMMETILSFFPPEVRSELQKMQNLADALKQAIAQAKSEYQVGKGGNAADDLLADSQEAQSEARKQANASANGGGLGHHKPHLSAKADQATVDAIVERGHAMVRKLQDVINLMRAEKENTQHERGLKRGALDIGAVAKIASKRKDVFMQKRVTAANTDVAFGVCTDVSGSMFGSTDGKNSAPIVAALAAAAGLNWALYKAEKSSHLVCFDDNGYVGTEQGKQLTEDNLDDMLRTGGGTSIIEGHERSMKELAKASERTKVVFYITDGYVNKNEMDDIKSDCAAKHVTPYFIFIASNEPDTAADLNEGQKMTTLDEREIVPFIAKVAKKVIRL